MSDQKYTRDDLERLRNEAQNALLNDDADGFSEAIKAMEAALHTLGQDAKVRLNEEAKASGNWAGVSVEIDLGDRGTDTADIGMIRASAVTTRDEYHDPVARGVANVLISVIDLALEQHKRLESVITGA